MMMPAAIIVIGILVLGLIIRVVEGILKFILIAIILAVLLIGSFFNHTDSAPSSSLEKPVSNLIG